MIFLQAIFDYIVHLFDLLFVRVVQPFFVFLGQGLEFLIIAPLSFLSVPVSLQVGVVAVLTGLLSMLLRVLLNVEKKEFAFKHAFTKKREEQQNIKMLSDWKTRDFLYRTSDKEIDEKYNTYLAQRFARHGIVYLLPVFFALFWLENLFSPETLTLLHGYPFLIPLPDNSYGIDGLSVPFVFLLSYVPTLLVCFWIRKKNCKYSA